MNYTLTDWLIVGTFALIGAALFGVFLLYAGGLIS